MQIAARTGVWSGNPLPYLRRVAWIGFREEQWTDLGIPVINHEYVGRMSWNDASNNQFLVGSYGSGATRCWPVCVYDGSWALFYGGLSASLYAGVVVERVMTNFSASMRRYKQKLAVGDYEELTGGFTNITNAFNVNLGCLNTNNRSRTQFANCDLEFLKIYDFTSSVRGDLVMDLIGVLDLSGRPCFYDEVSGQLFYNQGTGEFDWGELDASSALVSTRGGGTKCLTPRRSYSRSSRPSARFCARTSAWEVAA